MLRLLKKYYPIRNLFFVAGEGLIIYLSVLLAAAGLSETATLTDPWLHLKVALVTLTCQLSLFCNELYDLDEIDSLADLGIRLTQALGAASMVLVLFYLVVRDVLVDSAPFIMSIGCSFLLLTLWRLAYNLILDKGLFDQKIIVIGCGALARSILSTILTTKDAGFKVIFVTPASQKVPELDHARLHVHECNEEYQGLQEIARQHNVKTIVAAFPQRPPHALPEDALLGCREMGMEVIDGNTFFEMLTGKLMSSQIHSSWLIFSEGFQRSQTSLALKQLLDRTLALSMLILLLPVILLTALLIKLESRGPVFYSQERLGMNNTPYRMFKFRSMTTDAEKASGPVWARTNDNRVTRVGYYIRKWRIDEIPQLLNVLRGEMSFVGPRPERQHFVDQLQEQIPFFSMRSIVKPGITGWAQVNYGYGATVEDAEEKLNYDLFYIKNSNIFMDLVIIVSTVKTVLLGVKSGAGPLGAAGPRANAFLEALGA